MCERTVSYTKTHMENASVGCFRSVARVDAMKNMRFRTFFIACTRRLHTNAYYSRLTRENRSLCIRIRFFLLSIRNAVAMNVMWYANSSVRAAAAFHCRFDVPNLATRMHKYIHFVTVIRGRRVRPVLGCCCASIAYHTTLATPFGSRNSARATHALMPLSSFAIRVMPAVVWLRRRHCAYFFFAALFRHITMESV